MYVSAKKKAKKERKKSESNPDPENPQEDETFELQKLPNDRWLSKNSADEDSSLSEEYDLISGDFIRSPVTPDTSGKYGKPSCWHSLWTR